jgi:hypothetical protein
MHIGLAGEIIERTIGGAVIEHEETMHAQGSVMAKRRRQPELFITHDKKRTNLVLVLGDGSIVDLLHEFRLVVRAPAGKLIRPSKTLMHGLHRARAASAAGAATAAADR